MDRSSVIIGTGGVRRPVAALHESVSAPVVPGVVSARSACEVGRHARVPAAGAAVPGSRCRRADGRRRGHWSAPLRAFTSQSRSAATTSASMAGVLIIVSMMIDPSARRFAGRGPSLVGGVGGPCGGKVRRAADRGYRSAHHDRGRAAALCARCGAGYGRLDRALPLRQGSRDPDLEEFSPLGKSDRRYQVGAVMSRVRSSMAMS
jgi:hypothetical protein